MRKFRAYVTINIKGDISKEEKKQFEKGLEIVISSDMVKDALSKDLKHPVLKFEKK